MKNVKKWLGKVALACVLISLLAGMTGCGKKASTTSDSASSQSTDLEKIKAKRKIVVGLNADYAPYAFHAMVAGKDTLAGIDVDVAQAIADDLGVELEIQEANFDVLISSLIAGKCDIIVSCLSPTEERKKQIDFTETYSTDNVVAMIRKEDAAKYTSFDSLKGKKIGCAIGTIQETLTKALLPNETVEYREGMAELFLELAAGQVDAVVSTEMVCKMTIANNPNLAIAENSTFDMTPLGMGEGEAGVAVGVRKKQETLVTAINETIDRLNSSGEIDTITDNACDLAASLNQ